MNRKSIIVTLALSLLSVGAFADETIKINLTDRHIDALCSAYGYRGDNDGKLAFASDKVLGFIEGTAESSDVRQAMDAARAAKVEELKTVTKASLVKAEVEAEVVR